MRFGLTVFGAGMAVFCFLILGLAVMDAETMRLPDAFTLPGIALGVVFAASLPAPNARIHLWNAIGAIVGAASGALLILIIRWIYYFLRRQEGMGMGDVKLFALIAAWIGPELTLLTLVLGTTAAALYGVALVAAARTKAAQTRIPFGAFLCAAALFSLFAGQPLVHWYLGFFR